MKDNIKIYQKEEHYVKMNIQTSINKTINRENNFGDLQKQW